MCCRGDCVAYTTKDECEALSVDSGIASVFGEESVFQPARGAQPWRRDRCVGSSGDAQDAGRGNGARTLVRAFVVALASGLYRRAAQRTRFHRPAATFVKKRAPSLSAIPLGLQQHFSNVRQPARAGGW